MRILEFGILTGILIVAKESLFSGLNNLVVNTILDEKYFRSISALRRKRFPTWLHTTGRRNLAS